jgi:uncharacterized protein (TIGR03435 family)
MAQNILTSLATASTACLFAVLPQSLCGQQADTSRMQFEVASVKLHTVASPTTGRSGIEETKGLIRIENLSLKAIIQAAYGVKDFQYVGPAWLEGISFDIVAKPPAEYTHQNLKPLLQDLLAQRFKLAIHHESRDESAFALLIARGGPKLREASKPRDYFTVRPGLIACTRASTAELASALARILGRPVADNTGLTAAYDIKVEWTPDQAPPSPTGERTDVSEPGLSLFTALNDQLGLRLLTQKMPVDVVIVDHVEKMPTEN